MSISRKEVYAVAGYCGSSHLPVVPWVGEPILHVRRNKHLLVTKAKSHFSGSPDLQLSFHVDTCYVGTCWPAFRYPKTETSLFAFACRI